MAFPDVVQYFKFDERGNMMVYEPGAGFSGTPRYVSRDEEYNISVIVMLMGVGVVDWYHE